MLPAILTINMRMTLEKRKVWKTGTICKRFMRRTKMTSDRTKDRATTQ